MEKRVSPLKVEEETKKAEKTVKKVEAASTPVKQKAVAKRVNPINLEAEGTKESVKIVEKVVEVVKEVPAPYVPAMKTNDLRVARKLQLFFPLSKSIVTALKEEYPNQSLYISIENAILAGLKVSDEKLYDRIEKELKGEKL